MTCTLRSHLQQIQGVRKISDKSRRVIMTEALRFLDACDT